MSHRYERISDILTSQQADELIAEDFLEKKRLLEEEFNHEIDECVTWGDFTYDEGEALKAEHHARLWPEVA